MRAVAIHACDAEDQDELSFQINDQFCDVQQSSEDGWLIATLINTQQRGLIPSTHVQLKDEDQPPKQQQVDTPPPVKPRPKIADVDVDSYSAQQQQQSAQQVSVSKKQKAPAPPIPLRSNNSSSLPGLGASVTVSAPDFIPADRFNSYVKIFRKHDPDNRGLVDASTVKQLWSTSGASKDSLAKVWQLVYDQNQLSSAIALKPGEFIIAMHIIARLVNDKQPVPGNLPPNQLQWARSFALGAAIASPTPSSSSRPTSSTNKNLPKQQKQQNAKVAATPKQSDNNAPPSQMEMFKYATSKDGQETAAAAQKIAGSKQGQMAMKAAYDNKETLIKVAQSDQAKAAGKAAWNNKEKVGKGVVRTANMIK
ncbi:hypothetical protein MP228_004115 [Amoeboaphelidium protococcarum]|nr:hypothetical protein MP228_004115 [Amoeboaphelidium protococcarum]